ncbi:hypothetical protein RDI58_022879 [Solanum bulbocastanum]|uniref:F-box domain-containing protein n=1 Tax=Solanum bulbocastanum TaxID=147425 RepID=A0AAN8T2X4_SOLBU
MLEFGERIEWTLQNVDDKLISDFCSKMGVKERVLKVWLYNNNKKKNCSKYQPTADILPELVIHKILSNLNYVEASQMTILSKTWLRAWFTNPNLLFVACSGTEEWRRRGKIDTEIVDKIMKRYMAWMRKFLLTSLNLSWTLQHLLVIFSFRLISGLTLLFRMV